MRLPASMTTAILAALLMAPGAVPAAAAGAVENATADFACGPHQVRLMIRGGEPSLMVSGERRAIERTRAASGVRYETADGLTPLVFWEKGPTALLRIDGGASVDCNEMPAAADEPLPFRARGQEPGWLLEITAETIRMEADYGEKVESAPKPAPLGFDNGRMYEAETDAHGLMVRIVDRVCHDAMSGAPYPKTVEVTLDGRKYDGCGGEPRELLTGGSWHVSELDGAAPPTEWPSSLVFEGDGRLYGHAGCNAYQTSYTLDGPQFRTEPAARTKKMCGTAVMHQEDTFLRLLADAQNWRIDDDGRLQVETRDGGGFAAVRSD